MPTVLVVDDDPEIYQWLVTFLGSLHQPSSCST